MNGVALNGHSTNGNVAGSGAPNVDTGESLVDVTSTQRSIRRIGTKSLQRQLSDELRKSRSPSVASTPASKTSRVRRFSSTGSQISEKLSNFFRRGSWAPTTGSPALSGGVISPSADAVTSPNEENKLVEDLAAAEQKAKKEEFDSQMDQLMSNLEEVLLTAAFNDLHLGGDDQLQKWSKALGRFGLSPSQASDLFELLDSDRSGDVSADEISAVPLDSTDYGTMVTPSLDLLSFLQFRYKLLVQGCRGGMSLTEQASLGVDGWLSAFARIDVQLTSSEVQMLIETLLRRQRCANLGEEAELTVSVLCHQIAIEGTYAAACQSHAMVVVRTKMLQGMFMTIDKDRSGGLDKSEMIGVLVRRGVLQSDAGELFDKMLAHGGGTGNELDMRAFCRAMAMDEQAIRSFRVKASAATAIAFTRARRRLLTNTLEKNSRRL